jgi:hypothetical protein
MDDAGTEDLQHSRRPTNKYDAKFLQKNEGINPPANSAEYQSVPQPHVQH